MPFLYNSINPNNGTAYKEHQIYAKSRILNISLRTNASATHILFYLNAGNLAQYDASNVFFQFYPYVATSIGGIYLYTNHNFGKGILLLDGKFQASAYSNANVTLTYGIYYEVDR